jgi:hypothetical protein
MKTNVAVLGGLFALLPFAQASPIERANGDFSYTCSPCDPFRNVPWLVRATCSNWDGRDGGKTVSEIQLNDCIANDHGKLVAASR